MADKLCPAVLRCSWRTPVPKGTLFRFRGRLRWLVRAGAVAKQETKHCNMWRSWLGFLATCVVCVNVCGPLRLETSDFVLKNAVVAGELAVRVFELWVANPAQHIGLVSGMCLIFCACCMCTCSTDAVGVGLL